jgi:hypothetical protein
MPRIMRRGPAAPVCRATGCAASEHRDGSAGRGWSAPDGWCKGGRQLRFSWPGGHDGCPPGPAPPRCAAARRWPRTTWGSTSPCRAGQPDPHGDAAAIGAAPGMSRCSTRRAANAPGAAAAAAGLLPRHAPRAAGLAAYALRPDDARTRGHQDRPWPDARGRRRRRSTRPGSGTHAGRGSARPDPSPSSCRSTTGSTCCARRWTGWRGTPPATGA